MKKKILIAADIVPTTSNCEKFIHGDKEYLIGEKLLDRFYKADYAIMNLEVPLTDEESPIRKCGPCLIAPTESIHGIKSINPYFLNLANNHILDQGVAGLQSTMRILQENKIDFAGAGSNLSEARRSYIKELSDVRVGIYCCAEHEYSLATENTPGANPYDPLESFDDVRLLKTECDYLIVLYHGGKEHYRYPSPMLQRIFHKFADVGADLVIAQHTHCIGCKEEYNNSTLVYGQGNFLFDNSDSEYWKTSLLIELDPVNRNIDYIPLKKETNTVREAEGIIASNIKNEFFKRSDEIKKQGFVVDNYKQFAQEMKKEYLLRFSGRLKRNPMVRIINKISDYQFVKWLYPDKDEVVIENVIACEAHRELAIQAMREK